VSKSSFLFKINFDERSGLSDNCVEISILSFVSAKCVLFKLDFERKLSVDVEIVSSSVIFSGDTSN
jgi:hypothetical protein